jgi:hypothetical protein
MGLDLLVLGKPKQGFESDFEQIVAQLQKNESLSPSEENRFRENVTRPFEELGAPRVGFDPDANDWMVRSYRDQSDQTPEDQIIRDNHDYHVLSLLHGSCDGVTHYTHGGLYEGVDLTSFRGAFLSECVDYLDKTVLNKAWTTVMTPDEAISYGTTLLASLTDPPKEVKRGFFSKLLSRRKKATLEEQKLILTAAGKWYVFWGSRGHYIQAYF